MSAEFKLTVIDAFSSKAFGGNPAAVCILESAEMPRDALLQSIAAEMNLSETGW
jgi:predicted PhzF superfamily epimerase YddE/YHI9